MTNYINAAKRVRRDAKVRVQNKAQKTYIKTIMRQIKNAWLARDLDKLLSIAPIAQSCFDRAAKKGLIHTNRAKSKKSTLHGYLRQLVQA